MSFIKLRLYKIISAVILLLLIAAVVVGFRISGNPKITSLQSIDSSEIEKITILNNETENITERDDIEVVIDSFQNFTLKKTHIKKGNIGNITYRLFTKNNKWIDIDFYRGCVDFGQGYYSYSEENNSVMQGDVVLVSKGITYTPYQHWVYGQSYEGTAYDCGWFGPSVYEVDPDCEEGLKSLVPIPANKDFEITRIWAYNNAHTSISEYRIYDESLHRIDNASNIEDLLEKKGIYYIAANTAWGDKFHLEGYQYIYKTKVE